MTRLLLVIGILMMVALCGRVAMGQGMNGGYGGENSGGGDYGSRNTAQTAAYTVNTTKATLAGKSETILVDGNGMVLYYLTSDTSTSSACTGGCVSVWPPLSSTMAPTAPASLPGKLTIVSTASGSQVSYNDHLLYRYRADAGRGQVNGNDKDGPGGGKWFVAMPGLQAGNGTGSSSH